MAGPDGNPWCPLVVDGVIGPVTTAALQWKVGADPDGQYGPLTSAAHENHLGLAPNQDLYPWNSSFSPDVLTMQNHLWNIYLYVPRNGIWDNHTTQGLQIGLNNGTY